MPVVTESLSVGLPTATFVDPSRPREEDVIEELRNDPEYAAEYLTIMLEDGDQQDLQRVLDRIAKAFGAGSQLASEAELSAAAQLLFKTLSAQGNPELKSTLGMLKSLGFRVAIKPLVPDESA